MEELIACEKGESSCSSNVKDVNEFLGRSKRASAKLLLSNEWETYIHHVGQKFDGGAEEFRLKLCKYALEVGFNFLYAGNDKRQIQESNSKMMRSRVVSSLFVDRIRAKP
ncbi:unnamed protein product [Prunus armeniaca]